MSSSDDFVSGMASTTMSSNPSLPRFVHPSHKKFWRGQVLPRSRQVFWNKRVAMSLTAAAIAPIVAGVAPVKDLGIQVLATAWLTYAALAFGACVTGAVLVLTLPSKEQTRIWATTARSDKATHSNLSDLLFVFTLSALLQLAVAATCGLAFVLGGDLPVWPDNVYVTHALLLSMSILLVAYALLQLIVVVRTISQIGVVLIAGINGGLEDVEGTTAN